MKRSLSIRCGGILDVLDGTLVGLFLDRFGVEGRVSGETVEFMLRIKDAKIPTKEKKTITAIIPSFLSMEKG
ncbi:hypothetical protein K8R43_02005 [archaeon]|nr:hypothetical protein [archaeon]